MKIDDVTKKVTMWFHDAVGLESTTSMCNLAAI